MDGSVAVASTTEIPTQEFNNGLAMIRHPLMAAMRARRLLLLRPRAGGPEPQLEIMMQGSLSDPDTPDSAGCVRHRLGSVGDPREAVRRATARAVEEISRRDCVAERPPLPQSCRKKILNGLISEYSQAA